MSDTLAVDLAAAKQSLAGQGYCVIEQALAGSQLAAVQSAIYRIAAYERGHGWAREWDYDYGTTANQRLWNLISRDPLFCELVEHDLALEFVRSTIGWPAMLSSSSANIVIEDEEKISVHADQSYIPEPWAAPHGVNIAWFVDDFTADNGATLVRPGSHLFNRCHSDADGLDGFVPIEAPAGSMLVADGRLWHGPGRNRSGRARAGIFNWYTLPIYLPQENWYLSVNPALRQFGSEQLQELLGFRTDAMGRVNGVINDR